VTVKDVEVMVHPDYSDEVRQDEDKWTALYACQRSFAAFLPYWKFSDPATGKVLTLGDELWPGQVDFVQTMMTEDLIFALKARKLGFTTLETAFDAWCARFRDPNGRVHLFSRRDAAAMDLMARVKFGMERLPAWMRLPIGVNNTHILELKANKDDVRTIEAYPTNKTTAVEQACTHAHIDEWGVMEFPGDVMQSVEPSIMRSAHIVTTVRGPVGAPADLVRRSQKKQSRFSLFFSPATKRPNSKERDLKVLKRSMPEISFRQEYPMTIEDALFGGSDLMFDPSDLDISRLETYAGPHGPERDHRYIHAWDIGRHRDAAVGLVLDVTKPVHHVVWYERYRNVPYPSLQQMIEKTHHRFGGLTVIEDNAAGEAVRENLDLRETECIGFKTTGQSKPKALGNLEVAFENQRLRIPDHEDFDQLMTELRQYTVDDALIIQDSVIALAIAEASADQAGPRKGKGRAKKVGRWQ
jgi:hypothetical protein